MADITFLGATKEIGKAGYLLEEQDETLLVDYGVKFGNPPTFPDMVDTRNLQGVALTHAHLDHTGGAPWILSKNPQLSLLCTPATRDIVTLLVHDMYKISRGRLPFSKKDLARVNRQCQPLAYEETMPIGRHYEMTLFNAGHIPGSAMVSVRYDGKRILFTGDFNATESRLCAGARNNLPKHDFVVTESTYARRINPAREEIEQDLVDTVVETAENGGTVLIPAFAVGRSQEVMCILENYGVLDNFPTHVDGMARAVNKILLKHPEYVGAPRDFESAMKKTHAIRNNRDRNAAVSPGNIIISPAGMLKGGASHIYFKKVHDDPRNAIVLVSFQIPGTPGAELLAKNMATVGNRVFKVTAKVRYHHLSSHSDANGMLEKLSGIPGDPEFFLIHGEPESCEALAQKLRELGRRATVPERNETYQV